MFSVAFAEILPMEAETEVDSLNRNGLKRGNRSTKGWHDFFPFKSLFKDIIMKILFERIDCFSWFQVGFCIYV